MILIDCSELELGRNLGRRIGRLDDSVVASRRKLQVYRDSTLPMLRALDEEGKLVVVRSHRRSLSITSLKKKSEKRIAFFPRRLMEIQTRTMCCEN